MDCASPKAFLHDGKSGDSQRYANVFNGGRSGDQGTGGHNGCQDVPKPPASKAASVKPCGQEGPKDMERGKSPGRPIDRTIEEGESAPWPESLNRSRTAVKRKQKETKCA